MTTDYASGGGISYTTKLLYSPNDFNICKQKENHQPPNDFWFPVYAL